MLCLFVWLVQWTFHPFVLKNKRFYTALLWYRVLMVLVVLLFTISTGSFLARMILSLFISSCLVNTAEECFCHFG